MSKSIAALVGLAIKLILTGLDSKQAVERIANDYNVDFSNLWDNLPSMFR